MMKKITTLMIALLAGFGSWAQCDGTFGIYNTPGSMDVTLYADSNAQTGTWVYDMGDNSVVTSMNGFGNYTYAANGTYQVCCTFDGSGAWAGCTVTYCDSVTIGNTSPPTCSSDFYWWQDYDSLNNTFSSVVYLVNMASGGVAPFTYDWNFGDGNTSNQQYPVHTYSQIGNYAICLSIADANGCADTFCHTISVVVKSSGFTVNVISESEVASVGIENEEVISLTSLYPNPVNESATLEFNATQNTNVDVTIIDISGKRLNNFSVNVNAGNNKIAVGTSDLANGYYILNLRSTDGSFTQSMRFSKQ